ncbi:hypothetical protein DIE13_03080 [Burkholderia sp. Bp9016]|nr:hypothetical protein DIE13_03080 [Burkholderia sp. Bp9016]
MLFLRGEVESRNAITLKRTLQMADADAYRPPSAGPPGKQQVCTVPRVPRSHCAGPSSRPDAARLLIAAAG